MDQTTNFLAYNYALTGSSTVTMPEIECEPGDTVFMDVLVESVNGTPTTASLAAKFQVAAIEFGGISLDSEGSAAAANRTWHDVVAADTYTGHLLLDGAWPTTLADQTLAARRLVTRRLLVPSLGRLVRLALTPAFTGGTTPSFKVTVAASHLLA